MSTTEESNKEAQNVAESVANAALPQGETDSKQDDSAADPAAAAYAAAQAAASGTYYKLFVGQVPAHMQEAALKPIFEPFGPLQDLTILRDRNTGMHKGCAFVFYYKKEDADRAIEALHDKVQLGPTKKNMIVRHAQKPGGNDSGEKGPFKLFVGMLSKQTDEDRLKSIFSDYGDVEEVYIMKGYDGLSRGCAFVKYMDKAEAEGAIAGLNDKFTDTGCPQPLNVKFADNQGKKKPQMGMGMGMGMGMMQNPYAMYGQGMPGMYGQQQYNPMAQQMQHGMGGYGAQGMGMGQMGYGAAAGAGAGAGYGAAAGAGGYGRAQESRGPPGANLFVYNIPETFGDGDLAALFSHFGTIISTKVFCDKLTGQSRGFGFVSYSTPEAGAQAIGAMNGFEVGNKRLKVALKTGDGSNQMAGGGGGMGAAAGMYGAQMGMGMDGIQQRRYTPY